MHQTRNFLFVLSLILLFVGFMLIATSKYGMTTTPDSIAYFSTATSLASGEGFILYDGSCYRNWPPLYPLILSVSVISHIPILLFAKIVSCLTFVLTVLVSYRFLTGRVKELVLYTGTALIACSYVLFKLNIICCSEPLFILFFTVFLFFFIRYLDYANSRDLYISAFFMSLMCVQRYAGLMCLIWVLPFLWQGLPDSGKLKKACLFMIISVCPVSLWALRNYVLNNGALGQHHLSEKINLSAFAENISVFWHAASSPKDMIIFAVIVTGLLLWIVSMIIVLSNKTEDGKRNILALLWLLCSGYGLLLLLQKGLQLSELPRYLSIIYIPFSFYLVLWIENQVQGNTIFDKALKSALVLFVAIQGTGVAIKAMAIHEHGNGYEIAEWMEGDAIAFIRNGLPEDSLISNYPDFIWLVRHQQVKFSRLVGEGTADFYRRTDGASYFLWIESQKRPSCIRPEEYGHDPHKLTLIARGNQYRLFRIN